MKTTRQFACWIFTCALVTIGSITTTAPAASSAVTLSGDRYFVPGTTVAGADTGMVFSGTGAGADYAGSALRMIMPPGMLIAHADTHSGVPTSPISNRPTEGDVVGTLALTSTFTWPFGDCSATTTRTYRFVWHEATWYGDYNPQKVAELGIEWESSPGAWVDYSPGGIHFDIFLTGETDGLPTYEARVGTTGTNGFFCSGAYFRQTGTFTAPAGKTLARNSDVPGAQMYCFSALTNSGAPTGYCNVVTLDPPDGTSPGIAATAVCTVTGTEGPDVLVGTSGDDVICGLGGDDRIIGGTGNDTVLAGDGRDRVSGGTGDDRIDGGSGGDALNGGSGNDVIFGGAGDDSLSGSMGDDVLRGGAGDDRATGAAGNDVLEGGAGVDVLAPGAGDDRAVGGTGADQINAGTGNDSVSGGEGDDSLAGNAGSDLVYGGPDADTCKPEPIFDLGIVIDC